MSLKLWRRQIPKTAASPSLTIPVVIAMWLSVIVCGCGRDSSPQGAGNGIGLLDLARVGDVERDANDDIVKLTVFGDSITDADLKQLPTYDKLQELVLQECRRLTNDGLSSVGESQHLVTLKLIRVPVSDEALAALKSSKTLTELVLAHTRVNGSGLRYLAGTPIAKLAIHGAGATASGLAALTELTSLRELELQCPDIRFQDLPSLVSLEHLESIVCPKTQLGPAGLDRLRDHPSVNRLVLNSSEITDDSVIVLNTMVALADLELSNARITDAGLSQLALPRLRRLSLGGCAGVTDAALSQLDQLQSLEVLELQATAVSGQDLTGLGAIRTLRKVLMSAEQFKGNQQTLSALKKLLPECEVIIMRG